MTLLERWGGLKKWLAERMPTKVPEAIAVPAPAGAAAEPAPAELAAAAVEPAPEVRAPAAPAPEAPAPPPMLRLSEGSAYKPPLAEWPLPPEPPFMGSRELGLLKADLKHYVDGLVRGRSYLIAGHRGAGKTSMVSRAVDQLAAGIMRESVLTNPQKLSDGPLQRPLLVKLHGPSMLTRQAPAAATLGAKGAAGQPAPQADIESGSNTASGVAVAAGAHAALIQITLGLYRALAGEAATGFRAHALRQAARMPGDQPELATQLALDLDGGAPPGLLRQYWASLNRLQGGVFWPETADSTCQTHGMVDQGLREIAALATAAQAFQVCTGRISYETKINQNAIRKLTSQLKGASDLKNSLNQLGTLGIGALTGVTMFGAAHANALGALAAGLGVWLLGSASLTWSRSTERNTNRSVDYSFIRDFTLETLERDLPVVINRVRDASLVPVFMIDELDKVADAPNELKQLIARLKHLIADFGFFCFLVNRDCFEAIEARIRSGAYPAEHTLFSERLLVRPNPDEALKYLTSLVAGDSADPQFALSRATFALTVMHRTQLNLTEMVRQLARAAKPGSDEIGNTVELTEPRRLIIATVQIAINETLRDPALAARMDADAGFAQLAMDMLYDPSRSWSKGYLEIDPSMDALKDRLERRMRPDGPNAKAGRDGKGDTDGDDDDGQPRIDPADLDLLQSRLVHLLNYLTNLSTLNKALKTRTALGSLDPPQAGDVTLTDIVPVNVAAICRLEQKGIYRFLYNRDGELIEVVTGRFDPVLRTRAKMLADYADTFGELLQDVGVTFDEVARTPLLKSVSAAVIAGATTDVRAALRIGSYDPRIAEQISVLERLHAEIGQESEKLGELLILVRSLERDEAVPALIMPAILQLVPFHLPPARWLQNESDVPVQAIPGDPEGLAKWIQVYKHWLLPAPGDVGRNRDDYSPLAEPLIGYFKNPRTADFLPVDYAFLLGAARGELPAKAMNARLANMTSGDWSSLAFAAAPRRGQSASAPYWVFIAALRGLGFGRQALSSLADGQFAADLHSNGWQVGEATAREECYNLVDRIAATSRDRPSGLLVVETEEERFGSERPVESRPTLIIDRRDYQDYLPVLNWLEALEVLGGVAVAGSSLDEVV